MDRRILLERALTALAVFVFLGLSVRNFSLEQRFRTAVGNSRPLADHFVKGDSVLRLPLLDGAGAPFSLGQQLLNGVELIYFFSPHCPSCERQWPGWIKYLEDKGYSNVLFVDTEAQTNWDAPPGIDKSRILLAHLGRPNPLKDKIPYVPLLVKVNSCGIIEELPRLPVAPK